jgi:hypothetical protein
MILGFLILAVNCCQSTHRSRRVYPQDYRCLVAVLCFVIYLWISCYQAVLIYLTTLAQTEFGNSDSVFVELGGQKAWGEL